MNNNSENKVIPLIICHTCHERIKTGEPYTIWEKYIYCDECFNLYEDLIFETLK